MKILVTGSHGFIGKHLVERLEGEGHTVNGYDTKVFKNAFLIPKHEFVNYDMVIHLAASANVRESLKNPNWYFYNNVQLTKTIQRNCEDANVPLVYASSSCVHNWHLSPYGTSKMVNEQTAFKNQVGLRFTTVYGDGARDTMLFEKIKAKTLTYATSHIRDFIHIDDVVDAIMIFVNTGTEDKMPTYEVGTGRGIRVDELVNDYFKMNVPVVEGMECEAKDNTCLPDELKKLGWNPTTEIRI